VHAHVILLKDFVTTKIQTSQYRKHNKDKVAPTIMTKTHTFCTHTVFSYGFQKKKNISL